jgi:hypothetical protein
MATLKKEFDIRYGVIMGDNIDHILNQHGTF